MRIVRRAGAAALAFIALWGLAASFTGPWAISLPWGLAAGLFAVALWRGRAQPRTSDDAIFIAGCVVAVIPLVVLATYLVFLSGTCWFYGNCSQ